MSRRAARAAAEFGMGIIGLAAIAMVVTNRNGAAMIQAVADSHKRMVAIAMGERAVAERDIIRFEQLLGESSDEIITELFAGLNDADLNWIEEMLNIGNDERIPE